MAFGNLGGLIGVKRMERKIQALGRKGGPRVAGAAMSAMATPLKAAIRLGVKGTTASKAMKRAANATVGHRRLKPKFDEGDRGIKVGFGVGTATTRRGVAAGEPRVPTAKAAKATKRAGSKRPGVGISATNIQWAVLGTGSKTKKNRLAGSNLAPDRRGVVRKSKATGKTRRKKSGASTGSTARYFTGVVQAAVTSTTPIAMKIGAVKARATLRKIARKRNP